MSTLWGAFQVDVLIKTKDKYLHIEINTETEEYLHNRNFSYFTKVFSSSTKRGEEYDIYTEFIHIDFTYNLRNEYKTDTIKNEYSVINKEGVKYVRNFKIIEYDMDLLKKKWYTMSKQEKEKYQYLMMLDLDKKELKEISKKGDKLVMEYEDKVNELNESETFESLMTWEEDYEKRMKTNMHLAEKRGKEEGQKETQLSTAKEMLKDNIDLETISKYTKLSIDEIKNLNTEED